MKQHSHEDYLRLKEEFESKEKSMQERLWIDSTVGELDDLLRTNYDKSVSEFGRVVIEHLAQLTNAYHGIFYIAEQEERIVKAVAGFACKVENLEKDTFAFGETIVSQAVLSQEKIKFENLTGHNTQNTSLVGQLKPHTAIVVPLLFNQVTHGVLELVFVNALETRYELFLDRVGQNIGAMLESILNSAKMQKLLDESQQQSEKLLAQEEELRQNLEEMSATREAQDRAQSELEHLKSNLEKEVAEQTKRLEESMQKFDLAMDATTEGLWDLIMPKSLETQDDTPFWWSNNFRRMLGYENEEDFPNRLDSWANLLHPDHKEKTLQAFNDHLMDFSGQTPYDVEYKLLRKTGEYRWYRAVGNTFRDEMGKPIRVAGSLIDIQEAKDLEVVRKDLVQKYDLAMETTTEGLWDMEMPEDLETKDDTPFWWADNFRKMLGYQSEEDFPNRLDSWANLLHPDHKDKTLEAFSAHLLDYSGKTPYDVEYQLLRKTGEYHWYRAVGNTLRDEDGKPLRVAGSLIDIQEQKDLEVVRKDLVQKYDLAMETTTEGLWDMEMPEDLETKDDTPFWWADNFRKMLGYENEEDFPNRLDSWANLLHPDHKDKTLEAFSAHLLDYSGKTPYDVEYKLKRKTGEYRWYRAVGNTLRDETGKPLRVAGSLIDIQERKDLEAVRKDLIQKYDLAMETTTEGLWDMEMPEDLETKDDTPFWWADNFRKMLGYQSEEDFPNRLDSWANLLHPDHKEKTLEAFSAHLLDYSGKTPYDVEYKLKRKTGEYRWYRAVGNTLRDETGKPLRVAGSLIDIQEAKDLEAVRKDLIQKYDLAMETTTEGLWDMIMPDDLETKDDTPFWWADNFRKMLGYENEEDFPNRLDSWANLLHPDHKDKTLEAFSAHLLDYSGQTPYNVEYQLLRKTGEYRWYRAVGNTLRDETGKPLRVAGSLIDIQEQKELMSFKEHYELFLQSSDEGFWYTELNGNVKLKLDTPFFWSNNFRRLLGFESEEDFPNVLASWETRLHPEDKSMAFKAFYAFLEDKTGQTSYNTKYRIQAKDGTYHWFKGQCTASRNEEGLPLKVGGHLSLLRESEIPNQTVMNHE